jgi:3',5'-cyclic AMP phosphodiesterase CpdA
MQALLNRRAALQLAGSLVVGGAAGRLAYLAASHGRPAPAPKGGALRVAHLTDVHVSPGDVSGRGLARCLRHVQSLPDKPDLVLNGGDAIWNATADAAANAAQWDLWRRVLNDHCGLPVEHCLGNHDLCGTDPDTKARALDALGLAARYRSFDRGGWHFIVLDSIALRGDDYQARLDEEQFDWLREDLARLAGRVPVLVLTHAPILSAAAFFDGDNERTGNWVVPGRWMHIDARRLRDLFREHPNVKLCLSGHLHLCDRVEYEGVTYLCNGAVSGDWWKGAYQGCPPGYAVLDLHGDGGFRHWYVSYS